MRGLLLITLVASTSFGQVYAKDRGRFGRTNERTAQGRSTRGLLGENLAFFEFAPSSGRGMTPACACTTPTGAKGETLTFTRTGNATCSKQGLATTGIANGDLVVCAGDQPRVESSGGVLGLRVEGAATNLIPRSESVDNAAWTKEQDSAPRTPTVTADQSASPVAGTTADRVQFPATTGAEYSDYYQATTTSLTTGWTCSVYVKGFSGSGTLDVCGFNNTGGWLCSACAFNATDWVRCSQSRSVTSGVSSFCKVGNNSLQNGGVARAASDVLVVAHQGEEKPYATSYIPTVAAAVTRNAEAPYLTMPVTVSPRSWAATSTVPFALANVNNLLMDVRSGVGVTDFVELFHRLGTANFGTYAIVSSSPQQVNGTVALGVPGTNRAASWYAPAGTLNVISNGTTDSAATALGALPALDRVYLGTYVTTGAELNGIVSRVCVDPDSTRCR